MSESTTKPTQTGTIQNAGQLKAKRNFKLTNSERNTYLATLGVAPPVPAQGGSSTSPTTASPAVGTQGTSILSGLLQPQWNTGITIKKAFKGDAVKKTCLIEVGGKDYVLKGAPRSTHGSITDRANRSTAQDNAMAATLIRGLNQKGVRAPVITMLDDTEKAEVVAALQAVVNANGAGAQDASELITSLSKGDAQLSEPDDGGTDSAKIFPAKQVQDARAAALGLRRQHAADPNACWAAVIAAAGTMSGSDNRVSAHAGASGQAQRKQAVAAIRKSELRPTILEFVAVLEEVAADDLAAGLHRAEAAAVELTNNQNKLRAFAKSPEGMAAYGSVAVVDLVTGMDDRILGAWNGGNFLYDANADEFACVDNNKRQNMGLTETDSPEWNMFFLKIAKTNKGSISDAIFDAIYTPDEFGDDDDKPAGMAGFSLTENEANSAKDIIRQRLADVIQKVESDASSPPAAVKRVGFLKELMLMQDLLTVPHALACQGGVDEPSTTEKVVRGLKAIKRGWFAGADTIKSNLRKNPSLAGKTRSDLQALIAQHPKDSAGGTDRLAQHIQFLATAAEFGQLLAQRAARLSDFTDQPAFLTDAGSKQFLDDLAQQFAEQAALWQGSLKSSDSAIIALIATGAADLKKACIARQARY